MVPVNTELNSPITPAGRLMQNERGFTLVELLMVVALIGVLATIALSSFDNFRNQTRTTRALAEIRGIEKDIIAYSLDKGNFPGGLAAIGWGDINDPWGSPYVYATPGSRTYIGDPLNTDFDLYSLGPDRTTTLPSIGDSDDDIVRAGNGTFVVVAVNYGL